MQRHLRPLHLPLILLYMFPRLVFTFRSSSCWRQSCRRATTSKLTRATRTSIRRFMVTLPTSRANNITTMSGSTATTTKKQETDFPLEMSEQERYLFDLQGYLVVPNVLTADEVAAANAAIDRHAHEMVSRTDGPLRNTRDTTSAMYGSGPGRKDLGRVLEWTDHQNEDGSSDSTVFASILAHPRLLPLFHAILGEGYHMDHLPLVIAQDEGAEGFSLHGGTVDCVSGAYNPHLAYTCAHGTMRAALLGVNVILTPHHAGDGGFCIVPGSHKSNFKMPPGMTEGLFTASGHAVIHQPVTQAGDVILFAEGTVHGALPWTPSNRQRRVCLYRFAPATNVYGRSYFGHGQDHDDNDTDEHHQDQTMGWPRRMYQGLTDAQRAVLEPPYANRLDRPTIQPDGSVTITSRNARKKQHDRDVFGTPYF